MIQADLENYACRLAAQATAINNRETVFMAEGEAFMLWELSAVPKLHVLCQPELAEILKSGFESVQPSSKMDPSTWVEILQSGQIGDDQICSLIDLAYEAAKARR
jgi:predicted DNA-binding protein (MmcQ/YjbR family)